MLDRNSLKYHRMQRYREKKNRLCDECSASVTKLVDRGILVCKKKYFNLQKVDKKPNKLKRSSRKYYYRRPIGDYQRPIGNLSETNRRPIGYLSETYLGTYRRPIGDILET